MNQKVCAITATKNRHRCIERNIRFFLNQDYENCIQLIYNNSPVEQRLNSNIPEDKIILINNHLDLQTHAPYTTLGAIYRDAFTFVPEDVDIICFFDDDDLFLPNHISEGVKGLERGGKKAYKPQKSYFKTGGQISFMENTFEPSIFVKKEHIEQYGFSDTTSDQHIPWVNGLVYNDWIYVDPKGVSTLIYTWGDEIPTFKTSGNAGHPNNFKNYEEFSKDVGDRIITPISQDQAQKYYITKN